MLRFSLRAPETRLVNVASRLLLFGASGAIGSAVAREAISQGWRVFGVGRGAAPDPEAQPPEMQWLSYDPLRDNPEKLDGLAPFDAVCWAQGANMADKVGAFEADSHMALYQANCLSVMVSADALVRRLLLREGGARLVVVSSIWQERARPAKLSYIVTKAAIGGFVRSASVDLGSSGHLVNAVLPGVLDTPMTAASLSSEQIERIREKTPLHRLPDLASLVSTILFLCSQANTSISGQSITVDLGMNNACLL